MAYNSFREAVAMPNELQNNQMIFFDRDAFSSEDYRSTFRYLENTFHYAGVQIDDDVDIVNSNISTRRDIDYITDPDDPYYGAFAIKMPGPVIMAWTVSQLTGRSLDGTFLELRYREFSHYTDPVARTGPVYKDWIPLGSSAVLKNSATDGMGCVWVGLATDDKPGYLHLGPRMERLYFGIFNSSDNTIKINREHYMKASMIMFGIGKMGGTKDELEYIINKIEALPNPNYEPKKPSEVRDDMRTNEDIDRGQNEVIAGEDGLQQLYATDRANFDKMTTVTTPVTLFSPTIPGLGTSVINVGNLHNFWNHGFVNTINPIVIEHQPGELGGIKVYLGETESNGRVNYEPLKWFQRETAMVGMCYVTGSESENDFIPIFIDETGVYLKVPGGYSFKPGSTFNFIRGVILRAPV